MNWLDITITMKIDYISCTKLLCFAEAVVNKNIEQTYHNDYSIYVPLGMTSEEFAWICDQFENEGLLTSETGSVEGEDKYGNMNSEYDFEFWHINKERFERFIIETKLRHQLSEKAVVSREAIVSIAQQIEKTFVKKDLLRAVASFSNMTWCIEKGTYSLTDCLFREAYSKMPQKPFAFILAEFLNPIYFTLETQETSQNLFDYIDKILFINTEKNDYELWQKEAGKYVEISPNSSPSGENQKRHRTSKIKEPAYFTETFKLENSVGKLGYGSDGLIYFNMVPVDMTAQLKDLCRMFIDRPKVLVTIDDIKDTIITANRRGKTSNTTIAKYISALRVVLQPYYKSDFLISKKKEGWRFEPPKEE